MSNWLTGRQSYILHATWSTLPIIKKPSFSCFDIYKAIIVLNWLYFQLDFLRHITRENQPIRYNLINRRTILQRGEEESKSVLISESIFGHVTSIIFILSISFRNFLLNWNLLHSLISYKIAQIWPVGLHRRSIKYLYLWGWWLGTTIRDDQKLRMELKFPKSVQPNFNFLSLYLEGSYVRNKLKKSEKPPWGCKGGGGNVVEKTRPLKT